MNNFPGNSRTPATRSEPKAVEQVDKRVERVTVGEVTRRKKPRSVRFKEAFFGGDSTSSIWELVMIDIIIPSIKDTISDAAQETIERMIFGDSRPSGRRSRGRSAPNRNYGHTNYASYSSRGPVGRASGREEEDRRPSPSRRARATHDFDELILASRVEADEILEGLYTLLEKYDAATVRDLYHLAGVTSQFTDEKYGWTDLSGSGVQRLRGGQGYLLNLPRPEQLD